MIALCINQSTCNPGQWRFLQSKTPSVLLAGGFGSGKTLGLGLKLLQLKSANPNVPGLFMAQTWRAMWSTTFRRFMGLVRMTMPRDAWPIVRDRQGECFMDFGDGVPIYLRSAHDPASFDGLDVGYGLMDEARHCTKTAADVFAGRVRMKCDLPQKAYASTPSMNWLADEFDSGLANHELIRAPTLENIRNLAPDYEANLRLSYSKRMQQAVLDGLFVNLEGSVFEQVDFHSANSPWLVDYFWQFNKSNRTILAVDPGFRKSAWLLIHETRPCEWTVFHEWMPEETSDASCVQMINDFGCPIDEIWCDPAADATQSAMSLDTIAMLQGIKMRGRDSNICYITGPFRDIKFGVDKVRTTLGDPSVNQPIRVKFARKLKELEDTFARAGNRRGILHDLVAYRYPEERDDSPVKDLPLKDGVTDHSNDALRMFVVGMWLTSPLRDVDPALKDMRSQGFKRAA